MKKAFLFLTLAAILLAGCAPVRTPAVNLAKPLAAASDTLASLLNVQAAFPSLAGGLLPASADAVKARYTCKVVDVLPYDLMKIRHGGSFDIRWVIVNTGNKTWRAGIDVTYLSGPEMTSDTLVEIPVEVKPGESYRIDLDAVAPEKHGRQVMVWKVEGNMCFPYTAITVR